VILTDPERDITVSVPVHAARSLGRGILRDTIKQAGMSVEEFLRFVR
jgi:predicted RNA binding protein YcfA (HicA-like mRNA interferase family)